MGRTTILGLLLFGLTIAAIAARNGAMLLLALPVSLYLSTALLRQPRLPQLTISRTLSPERAVAHQPVSVTLTITNQGGNLHELHLRDGFPSGLSLREGNPEWLLPLAAGASHTFRYVVSGTRGLYRFQSVTATVWSWGSLIQRSVEFSHPQELFCFLRPPSRVLPQIAIRPRRTRVYSGSIAARVGGEGTDFFGVRNFRSGDELRRIHWKASARHRQALFTKEFEQERVADVGLILDSRHISNLTAEPRAILEYSIEATTVLADAFISQGNRVALLVYGDTLDYTLPGYGKMQREKIMLALARVQLGRSQVFAELRALPTRLFPARSQIVFISPLLAEDVPFLQRLRAYGYQVMVVSPSPVAYEANALGDSAEVAFASGIAQLERELLLGRLLQAGVYTLDWQLGESFADVAAAHLRAAGPALTEVR